jgi:hypothetical protein
VFFQSDSTGKNLSPNNNPSIVFPFILFVILYEKYVIENPMDKKRKIRMWFIILSLLAIYFIFTYKHVLKEFHCLEKSRNIKFETNEAYFAFIDKCQNKP